MPVPDLIGRDFTAAAPGRRLVGDIAYLPTQEGWLYLATVIDLHNREVVGHAMAGHMRAELVCDAITLAARRGLLGQNAIFHSDRGSQGGFNWSSQHPLMSEVVDDGNGGLEQEDQRCAGRCASAVARGSGAAARDALAWTA